MQQSYARVLGVTAEHSVVDLVEDALRMNAGAMDRHEVRVIREFHRNRPVHGGQTQGAANPGQPDPQREIRPG